MLKVAVIGPESTGKTTLAKALAAHFDTVCVPEYARTYLTALDRPYEQKDLSTIAMGQLANEERLARSAPELLFLDTDLYVIKVWSEFKYGYCDPYILTSLHYNKADLYLLTDYNIPYEEDPLRENPEQRAELFDIYLKEMEASGCAFSIVRGSHKERLQRAIQKINDLL